MLGFYEKSIVELEAVITEITTRLEVIRKYRKLNNYRDPIEYIKSRIKSEESMKEKLKRKGYEVNLENWIVNTFLYNFYKDTFKF